MFPCLAFQVSDNSANDGPGMVIVLTGIVIVLYLTARSAKKKKERIKAAKQAYQDSLQNLKNDPTNADLKQETLRLGRVYSNLARKSHGQDGIAIFDEVSISNDINAACAASVANPQGNGTIEDRLAKLATLKTSGLIDEAEFHFRRQRILNDV